MFRTFSSLALLMSCGGSVDSRVTLDVFTGTCDWSGDEWMGVERVAMSVEHAPGQLMDRALDLPWGGCSLTPSLLLDDGPLQGGRALKDVGERPSWSSGTFAGTLTKIEDGYWLGGTTPSGTCGSIDDVLDGGFQLQQLGPLNEVVSPMTGSTTGVITMNGETEHDWDGELNVGTEATVGWSVSGWERSFVQIRSYVGRNPSATLTCDTSGESSFTIDSDIWDELGATGDQSIELVVGFTSQLENKSGGMNTQSAIRILHFVR